MAENLKTERYANGDLIPNVKGNFEWFNLKTGAWCNYDNSLQNDEIYGKLYNWYAVADSRNVCPVGWHVSTDAEWGILIDYLGGEFGAGGKMKSNEVKYWKSPNESASNLSGFSGLPGGYRDGSYGLVLNIGFAGYWWNSSENSSNFATSRSLGYNSAEAFRNSDYKQNGFSVRCLKN